MDNLDIIEKDWLDNSFCLTNEEIEKLSKSKNVEEAKKIILEGTMDIVFSCSRVWYKYYNGKVTMEEIYDLCLDGLYKAVDYYMEHKTPNIRAIACQMIQEEISDKNSYENSYDEIVVLKPSEIFYLRKDEVVEDEFAFRKISSEEFMKDYNIVLSEYTPSERAIMSLLYDKSGDQILLDKEIEEITGSSTKKIYDTKVKVMKDLRNDVRIRRHHI